MNRQAVEDALRASIGRLLVDDRFLLEYDVHECAIAHRIAVYLEAPCADFNVDCEYNNDLDSALGRKEVYFPSMPIAESVRPDIIVHRRGRNGRDCNLLVVEIKKAAGGQGRRGSDRAKLESFTAQDGPNHFCYMLGAALILGVKDDAGQCTIDWFVNGTHSHSERWDL